MPEILLTRFADEPYWLQIYLKTPLITMFSAPQPLPARLLRFGGIGRLTFFAWLLLAGLSAARAQAPGWSQLALPVAAPTSTTLIIASALGANGDIYLLGTAQNVVTFGSTTFNLPNRDTFVAKWNPTSGFVWAVRCGGAAGSSNPDNANISPSSLAVQGNNVYIGGIYNGVSAAFGPTILLNGVQAGSTNNTFVAKLTDAGASASFDWATRLSYDTATIRAPCTLSALGANASGVYATGRFATATLAMGGITLTNASSSGIYGDVYVAKLTDAGASGSVTWALQAGGLYGDEAKALVVRGNQVYLAGTTASPTATFGNASAPAISAFQFATDAFVARLTDSGPTGAFDWVARAGGAAVRSDVMPAALALSGNSAYITGIYSGGPTFGTSNLSASAAGFNEDIFVAKLTDAGSSASFGWGLAAGNVGTNNARSLAANGNSVYLGGRYKGRTAAFGSLTLTNPSPLLGFSASAVYVAKLTDTGASGAWAWAQQGGSVNGNATTCFDDAASVLLGPGRGYLVGLLSNQGNTTTPNTTVATFGSQVQTVPGSYRPFLATWLDNTLLAAAPGKAAAPLSLWPNPAHGAATVRLPAGAETGPLVLLDNLGRVVRHFATPASGATDALLDLRGLPAGPYVLRGAGRAQRLAVE